MEFQTEVHDAELENLRSLVNRPEQNDGWIPDPFIPNEVDIKKVLDDFRKEYQDILEKAYEQERRDLIEECVKLERRIQELEGQLEAQKARISRTVEEIEHLKQELEELEKKAKIYNKC